MFDSAGERVDVYELVIFGDVDGDGWYDGRDAFIVSCIADKVISEEKAGKAKMSASDANRDGTVDIEDAELLQRAGVLLSEIDQNTDPEILMETQSFNEYLSLIDQSTDAGDSESLADNTDISSLLDFITSFVLKIINYIKQILAIYR